MKLQSNELRCTNLVTDNKGLEAYKIGELYYGDEDHQAMIAWNIDTPIEGISIERFEPIPLTEEWLLKFGFEKLDIKHNDGSISKGVFKKYPALIEINRLDEGNTPFMFCRVRPDLPTKYHFFTHIKYVHQLQNLYFALTGTELIIKE